MGDRWALVIGISRYQHAEMSLQYADDDARAFTELILSKSGGDFEPDHVHTLLNEDATAAGIQRALRSFLKKPAREDLVLIYLACHGQPDPDRPKNVYLLPYDTRPNDIAGSAVPMREIDLSLRETLSAEKVVILADTCHSGAIGGGFGKRRSAPSAAAVNRYLSELGEAKGGVALLTSAEANQTAQEGERWGGGHGVFTYHLLEGMRGAADGDGDGLVTVGELFEYVRDKVKEDTDHKQHPAIGTSAFDRMLPISVPGADEVARLTAEASSKWTAGDLEGALQTYREAQKTASGLRSLQDAIDEIEAELKPPEATRSAAGAPEGRGAERSAYLKWVAGAVGLVAVVSLTFVVLLATGVVGGNSPPLVTEPAFSEVVERLLDDDPSGAFALALQMDRWSSVERSEEAATELARDALNRAEGDFEAYVMSGLILMTLPSPNLTAGCELWLIGRRIARGPRGESPYVDSAFYRLPAFDSLEGVTPSGHTTTAVFDSLWELYCAELFGSS